MDVNVFILDKVGMKERFALNFNIIKNNEFNGAI